MKALKKTVIGLALAGVVVAGAAPVAQAHSNLSLGFTFGTPVYSYEPARTHHRSYYSWPEVRVVVPVHERRHYRRHYRDYDRHDRYYDRDCGPYDGRRWYRR